MLVKASSNDALVEYCWFVGDLMIGTSNLYSSLEWAYLRVIMVIILIIASKFIAKTHSRYSKVSSFASRQVRTR
jgi:hypothetical protein